jgi:hypothetical protein
MAIEFKPVALEADVNNPQKLQEELQAYVNQGYQFVPGLKPLVIYWMQRDVSVSANAQAGFMAQPPSGGFAKLGPTMSMNIDPEKVHVLRKHPDTGKLHIVDPATDQLGPEYQ